MAIPIRKSIHARALGGTALTPAVPGLRTHVLHGALIAALVATSTPVGAQQAGVAVDPSQSGAGAPRMDMAPNGTPVVKIAAPSASGVSRNLYTDFNVDARGLILNNSGAIVSTRLAGYIDGNGNLKNNGPAQIILNEVTGTNRSLLGGYLEVAGTPAELVIANPYGISCNGCGFINAPDVTMIAGRAMHDRSGAIAGYRVDPGNGAIDIGGSGLDASGARLALFARAINVNAGVWADRIDAAVGAGSIAKNAEEIVVTARGGTEQSAPALALDVAAIGGMYARSIRLVGAETGLGVNVSGTLASLEQGVSLSADGRVTIGGQVTSSGKVAIAANGVLDVGGTLYGDGAVTIAAGEIQGSGLIAGGSDVGVTTAAVNGELTLAAGLARDGSLSRIGNLLLDNSGALTLGGRALAHDKIQIRAVSATLNGELRGASADIATTGALTIGDKGAVRSLAASGSGGALTVDAGSIRNGGLLHGQMLAVRTGALDNRGGLIDAAQSLTLGGTALSNSGGAIQSAGAASITATSLANDGGALLALGSGRLDLAVDGAITNAHGTIGGNGDVSIDAASLAVSGDKGELIAGCTLGVGTASDISVGDGGRIAAGGDMALTAANRIWIGGAHVQSGGLLSTSSDSLDIAAGSTLAGDRLGLQAASLDNHGVIAAFAKDGASSFTVTGALANQGVIEVNSRDLAMTAQSLGNDGNITHAGSGTLALTSSGAMRNAGRIESAGTAALQAANLRNDGELIAMGDLSLGASGQLINGGLGYAGGALGIDAGQLSAAGGTLEAVNALSVKADSIALGNASLSATANNASLRLDAAGAFIAAGARLGSNGSTSLSGTSIDLGGSKLTALGTIDITANGGDLVLGAGGVVAASGAVSLTAAGTADASRVTVESGGVASFTGSRILLDDGLVQALGFNLSAPGISFVRARLHQTGTNDFTLNSQSTLDYSGGEILTNAQNFTLHAGSVVNRGGSIPYGGTGLLDIAASTSVDNGADGRIATNGTLNLSTADLNNAGGQISAVNGLTLTSTDLNNDQGSIISAAGLALNATSLSNLGGQIEASAPTTIIAATLHGTGGRIIAAGAGSSLAVDVSGAVTGAGVIGSTGNVQFRAGSVKLGSDGRLTAGGAYDARATTGDFDLGGGQVDAANITLTATNGSIRSGADALILTPGTLHLHAQTIDLSGGAAQGGNVVLQGGAVKNAAGLLQSLGALRSELTGTLDNKNGEIFASGEMALAASSLSNEGGAISHGGGGTLAVHIGSGLDNGSGRIATNGALDLKAATLGNSGQVSGKSAATLAITGLAANGGLIASGGALALTAHRVESQGGGFEAAGPLTLHADDMALGNAQIFATGDGPLSLQAAGTITAATARIGGNADVTLDAGSIDLGGSVLTAVNKAGIIASGALTLGRNALVAAGDSVTFNTSGALNASAAGIEAGTGVTLTGSSILLDDGRVQGAAFNLNAPLVSLQRAKLRHMGTDDFALTSAGTIDYSGGEIYSGGANFTLTAANIRNQSGAILHGGTGTMRLTATEQIDNSAGGRIATNGTLSLSAAGLQNMGGDITASGAATFNFGSGALHNGDGLIASGAGLALTAGALGNRGGQIEAEGNATLTLASLDGAGGHIIAVGEQSKLTLTASGAVASTGLLGAKGGHPATGEDVP